VYIWVIFTEFGTNLLYRLKGFKFLQNVVKLLDTQAHGADVMHDVHVMLNK